MLGTLNHPFDNLLIPACPSNHPSAICPLAHRQLFQRRDPLVHGGIDSGTVLLNLLTKRGAAGEEGGVEESGVELAVRARAENESKKDGKEKRRTKGQRLSAVGK